MILAELVIIPQGSTQKVTRHITFERNPSRLDMLRTARQLMVKCRWQAVRLEVGEYRSNWQYLKDTTLSNL